MERKSAYRELDAIKFAIFRRRLLRARGGAYQRRLLQAAQNNETFVGFVREEAGAYAGKTPPLHEFPLTESEFKDPPWTTEMSLYEAWKDLPARTACRPAFWADVTSRHVEDARIDASYLAANGGTAARGAQRMELALGDDSPQRERRIDDCVRTILRRLGGLPEARGTRTVYVDCPFARAWWRERLVREIGEHRGATVAQVRSVLCVSQSYWEELVTLVVSRNSVLGSDKVRSRFILGLADLLFEQPDSPLRTGKELRRACRALGVMQASRELSVLEDEDLQAQMDRLVRRQHEASVTRRRIAEARDIASDDSSDRAEGAD